MDKPPQNYHDAARGERLQRVLADRAVASRRHCEELVLLGRVTVNGHVVNRLPAWVDPAADRICVDGKLIRAPQPLVYIMLFKPRGYVCTNADPEGRPIALDLVDHPFRSSLFCVGRLDLESSGLLLLTNDGELSNRLTHPSRGIQKVYELSVRGQLQDDDLRKLEQGIFLNELRASKGRRPGRKTAPVSFRILKRDASRTHLLMQLHEGRNRQVRRMLADVGHEVKKLRRIQIGPLRLKGLQPAQWRELALPELKALRRAVALLPSASTSVSIPKVPSHGSKSRPKSRPKKIKSHPRS